MRIIKKKEVKTHIPNLIISILFLFDAMGCSKTNAFSIGLAQNTRICHKNEYVRCCPLFFSLILIALTNIVYFALHMANSSSFPRTLTAEEEQHYLKEFAKGDINARNKLIEHNLRLVAHIIKKYYSSLRDQDDLISIGTIGLIKAVTTFNESKGTKLATYAARCIENEILMCFRNQKKSSQNLYISDPIDTDSDGNVLTLLDVISTEDTILDDIDLKLKSESLHKYMKEVLDPRERIIIKLRYGLDGYQPLTQREVAAKIGISRSYVSRIEKKALQTLNKQFMLNEKPKNRLHNKK